MINQIQIMSLEQEECCCFENFAENDALESTAPYHFRPSFRNSFLSASYNLKQSKFKPVEEQQCSQCSPVAEQQRANEVQHGEELHQPGHSQDGPLPLHTVTQHGTHIQDLNSLRGKKKKKGLFGWNKIGLQQSNQNQHSEKIKKKLILWVSSDKSDYHRRTYVRDREIERYRQIEINR